MVEKRRYDVLITVAARDYERIQGFPIWEIGFIFGMRIPYCPLT